ncbi:hypothetical protein SESBI_40889 [Sesbania bispinosa]|nr:hypothetical protein SESBI_40889 [Sesbania bispinosa]
MAFADPSYIVGKAELEALKQGKNLANFKFACIGYSIYLDNKSSSADSQKEVPKLPISSGLQMLMIKKPSVSPDGHVPHPAHKSEGIIFLGLSFSIPFGLLIFQPLAFNM